MRRRVRLTEGDLHRIVKRSVKRVLREGANDIVSQFAETITNLDGNSASFIAQELYRSGCNDVMEFIINHMNGYGYGGPDVNGNYNY